jgi:hypothetical protein
VSAGSFQLNDKEILLFGGKSVDSKLERKDKIYKFNAETMELQECKEKLPSAAEFP